MSVWSPSETRVRPAMTGRVLASGSKLPKPAVAQSKSVNEISPKPARRMAKPLRRPFSKVKKLNALERI